jgi:hypothetical protein
MYTTAEIHTHLPYPKHFKLEHSYDGSTFDGSLLIDVDNYWDIVGNQHIQGPGPTAVSSEVDYLLSGSTYANANHNLVESQLKYNNNKKPVPSFLTVASFVTFSESLSSVVTPTTKVPSVRQPSLSTAQHTVILVTAPKM